jgi:hypothetical protein
MNYNRKDKDWILYITIPLFMGILVICATMLYLNSHPYPLTIGFTTDNNTLELVKIYNSTLLSQDSTENLQKQDLNTASCDFNGVDSKKYSCCEEKYKVTFLNSSDWLCEEDVWKEDRLK